MSRKTDWLLAAGVKAGDDRAFDDLIKRYKRPVLNFVFRMLGNAAEANDVAQDVFVRAYQSMLKPGFHQTNGAFSTWLFKIARNAALDKLRYRHRHPAVSLSLMAEQGVEPAAGGATPSQAADKHELAREIADAVAGLPEDQRAALILFEYEGVSHEDIAGVMQCTRKAVENRLYRARRTLRRRLAHWLME